LDNGVFVQALTDNVFFLLIPTLQKSRFGKIVVPSVKRSRGLPLSFGRQFRFQADYSKREQSIDPTIKKIGRPSPPVCRAVKKPVGPIDRKGSPAICPQPEGVLF